MKRISLCIALLSVFVSQCLFAGIDDGLIGYWPLDGDTLDYSGNGYDGQLLEGASFIDNPTGEGLVLQTQVGPANTGHVQVGIPASHYPEAHIAGFQSSGALWIWFDDRVSMQNTPGWQGILGRLPGQLYVSRNLNENRLWTMMRHGDRTRNTWAQSHLESLNSEGEWYHIAWTVKTHEIGQPGHYRWYINGVLASPEHNHGVLTLGTAPSFFIGADYTGQPVNSKIAEVRLYNRVITEDEIAALSSSAVGVPAQSINGALEVRGNIYSDGVLTLGNFLSPVDELLNTQQGTIRFNGTTFEGFDGIEWRPFTSDRNGGAAESATSLVQPGTTEKKLYVDAATGAVRLSEVQGDISMGAFSPFIDLSALTNSSYDLSNYGQDGENGSLTQITFSENGREVAIGTNSWKALRVDYEITPATVLSFQFRSDTGAEILGIGFDNTLDLSTGTGRLFRLAGTQNVNQFSQIIQTYSNYIPGQDGWRQYRIPVGEFMVGQFPYLVLVCDRDWPGTAEARFRNVMIAN